MKDKRQSKEAMRIRDDARKWLLHDNKDFPFVCHMAQLDPSAVRDEAQRLSRNGWPARKPERIAETLEVEEA